MTLARNSLYFSRLFSGFVFVMLMSLGATFSPQQAEAQTEVISDTITIERASVLEVSNEHAALVPGTDTSTKVQTLKAEIHSGVQKGTVVTFENDYTQLAVGDQFYIRHVTNSVGERDFYTVSAPYRLNILIGLAVIFIVLLFMFGGAPGVRGLASLCGSLVLIFYLLLPGILAGYSPVLVSIGVSSLIIILGSYITHGFNRTTTAAVVGMISTVVITGLAAYWAVDAAHLSGYASEENVYLNFDTRGSINMVGLLFGGIMIGLLGVLYDIAIGQAVTVEELLRAGSHLSRGEVYLRAIRIGREHIGALVNTLAIAYVGVSLPLLLLIQNSSTMSVGSLVNSEQFATEIVRILIGSIGLVLAVPITTLVASYILFSVRDIKKSTQHTHHH